MQQLQQALADDIGDVRLMPYIQLHEFEAMLFCDLPAFEIFFDNCQKQLDALAADVGSLLQTPNSLMRGNIQPRPRESQSGFLTIPI